MTYAFSAEEALKLLEQGESAEIALILSDINMPGMNGLELLRIIKDRFPEMKVFMITAYNGEDKYRLACEYGCDEYLTKPLDFEILKEKILNEGRE